MARVKVSKQRLDAGGGPFALDTLTLGVFGNSQTGHRIATGRDKADVQPISAGGGWIMPGGAEGVCYFDAPLDLVTVSFDTTILREAGLTPERDFRPTVGALDTLLTTLAAAATDWSAGGTLYRETMERALTAHLVQVIAPPAPESADIGDRRLRRVVDHIHAHLADDLSLAAMAREATLSEGQFTRAFRKATGASPLQYVIAARLDRAALRLKTTPDPVAAIAHDVGYGDLSRFTQHFRRRFGTTPAVYRAG
ncbi:MAG: AraC family transcriptional regulator [Pseudomonadota bacterium]